MDMDFVDWLRARDDERLRALVAARPELVTPVPAHIPGLASRATSLSATGRALDRLDRFALATLETLAVLPSPVSLAELRAIVRPALAEPGRDADAALHEAVERLRTLALAYGPDDALAPAPGVREALEAPAGLGPPAAEVFRHHPPERLKALVDDIEEIAEGDPADGADPRERLAELLGDPAVVAKLLAEVPPKARAALDALTWGPPTGSIPDAGREVRPATARSPVEHLLARGLLGATGERMVTLPREVALHLRDGRLHRDLRTRPPDLRGAEHDPALCDRTAAGQAFTFVRAVEELCERWSVEPPGVLRTGGLAVRDLKRTAQLLELPEWAAALVVEVAFAAGLIASGGGVEGEWLPTPAYDTWLTRPGERRWAALAAAWLATDRVPGLVGERDERDRLRGALHPDLRGGAAPEIRSAVLGVLATAPAGLAPTVESVLDRLEWERPRRRGAFRDRMVEFTLREAEQLGVTGLGALSGHGRALIDRNDERNAEESTARAAETLAPLLPEPVDHVLLQADLTAVAPGPLTSELRRSLALVADVESTGGATVYRFSEHSVRRALDAGQGADELLAMLERHSTTPVPQPLRYLVTDVARRHGRVRVGTASAYIRCDDPAVLDQVMADRQSLPLRLRRLASTVIASRSSRAVLVDALRAMGYAPVAESLEGDVLISRLDARRTDAVPPPRPPVGGSGPDPETVAAAVRALRAGDAAHLARRPPVAAPDGELPRSPASATISALREAIRTGGRVWIGYLDNQGQATGRILEPARMEGGYLTAYDETRAAVHRFALHRITGVSAIE
ncbi:Helicase conserved C-terminal domain-containing protein [Thermostaphylospora chromogena]|uniref:Helicase conserved C-terminal domain-containing protein n=2 Tax=Thermostaphylospora chromogena TaxID=35622 RepID=A0A1H1BP70_9ACTN|nr:helicase-associated domain-containing protein [Thermostaphylospora chromogena]SDQ53186.1 Helicase conserved C-terminal domain-containing protein [Thermostaphylospora chromogena]